MQYIGQSSYLLETDCDCAFKCFEGSRNALFEHNLKEHLFIHGYYNTDLYVKTIEMTL